MGYKRSFFAGVLLGALAALLLVLGFVGGKLITSSLQEASDDVITDETEEKLESIQAIIDSVYLYSDEIDEEALQEGIVDGYVDALNEPYTVYYNEEETKDLFESTTGEFGGVGITIMQDVTTMEMSFSAIMEDCPGYKAGFQVGDILYKVDGEEVLGQNIDNVITKIRGEVGTEVELTVLRDGGKEEYSAVMTRALIQNQTVVYEMLDDQIGYIEVSGFEDVTTGQFEEALNALAADNMKGLIIDLRSNPGGNLSVVVDMCDMILPEGVIVSVKDRDGVSEVYESDEEHKLSVPLVVLTNGNSASASEIFAGAVKDHGVGTLVGTTTFGKGIVQNIYQLSDGTSFKLTSSEYYTPNGTNIHGVGIEPDVIVEYDNEAEGDNQLEKAIEILRNGM